MNKYEKLNLYLGTSNSNFVKCLDASSVLSKVTLGQFIMRQVYATFIKNGLCNEKGDWVDQNVKNLVKEMKATLEEEKKLLIKNGMASKKADDFLSTKYGIPTKRLKLLLV